MARVVEDRSVTPVFMRECGFVRRDKDELLVSGFEHLTQLFEEYDAQLPAKRPHDGGRRYTPMLSLFKHAQENHLFYKAMIGKQGGEIVQRYLYRYTANLMGKHLQQIVPAGKKTPVPHEVVVHFMVSSLLSLLTWWVNHDLPCTPEQIVEMYYVLSLPGLNAGLGVSVGMERKPGH